MLSDDALAKLKEVLLVISDVDGTLSNKIHLDHEGRETKVFCEKDAPRIVALRQLGIPFLMISGRNSSATRTRAKELGVEFFHRAELVNLDGDPLSFLERRFNVPRSRMLYIGDDWGDLWWISQVLVSAAPADAEETCRNRADIVTKAGGGEGAVSEILLHLLKAKGLLNRIVDLYTQNFNGIELR